MPMIHTDRLITRARAAASASGLTRGRYTFHAAMDEADSTDESTDDMTAALRAPSPMLATMGLVR